MNAVNISVGGLITSIFFIFLCISLNAEQYYKELNIPRDRKNISTKAIIVLRDRSANNSTKINFIPSVPQEVPKPILIKEVNTTLLEDKKIKVLTPLSDTNLSLPNSVLENIQNKISTLLQHRQISFEKNSGTLSREGREVLDKLLILLSEQKNFILEVQGHTDSIGTAKVNQWISQIRANSVKEYLLQKGMPCGNIKAKGFGNSKLLLSNKPYSQKNRRVEIYIKRRKNVRIND